MKLPRALRADGEATRESILEAAGELLAAAGFAETTNKAIAARAGVDLASINYHFGSRSGLYQSVLVEAHRRLISLDDLRAVDASDIPARDKLRRLIVFLVDAAGTTHGWHAKVLSRELLAPTSHFESLHAEVLPKLQLALSILSEITSIPASDARLGRCLISVAAPCAMLIVAGQAAFPLAKAVLERPRDELAAHFYSFAMAGLEAITRESPQALIENKRS